MKRKIVNKGILGSKLKNGTKPVGMTHSYAQLASRAVLTQRGVFALLVALTVDGETVLRPIGGSYGSGVRDAIQEMDVKYPECKMRLFESRADDWRMYFEGEIERARLL